LSTIWAPSAGRDAVRALLVLAGRREARVGPAVVVALAALVPITGVSIAGTYGTLAQRRALATGAGDHPAFRLLLGPLVDPGTVASTTWWRIGLFLLAAVAVAAALSVVRLSRGEEDAGHAELVRAGALRPRLPLAIAVLVASAEAAATALLIGFGLLALGAGAGDAALVAGQVLAVGLVGVGTGALAAQLAGTARAAAALAGTTLVAAYALRGAADVGGGLTALRWVSPLGWAQDAEPFGAARPWPLGLCLLLAALLTATALGQAGRRDLGAGLLRSRPGPPRARGLRGPLALAVRTHRGTLAAWVGGAAAYAALVGVLLPSVGEIAGDGDGVRRVVADLGGAGALDGGMQAVVGTFTGLAAAAWAVSAAGRLATEERTGRTEAVLATAVGRRRLLIADGAVLLVGIVAICGATGLALGLAHALAAGSGTVAGDGLAALAVQVPAAAVLAALALLLYAAAPGSVGLGWVALGIAFLIGQLGTLLGLPAVVRDLSPFAHVAAVPVESVRVLPLVALAVVATALAVGALIAFERRDVPA
jgi:ABC-2 type transport system permease protein